MMYTFQVVSSNPPVSTVRKAVAHLKATLSILLVPVAITASYWHKMDKARASVLSAKPATDGLITDSQSAPE